MPTYSVEGIVIKRYKIGEADQIISICSKYKGKIKAIAKGSRKPTSKKSAALELCNHNRFHLAQGRNFDLIVEVETIKSFSSIKSDLNKSSYSFSLLELIDRLTVEQETHPDVFNLLLQALTVLSEWGTLSWQSGDLFVAAFSIKLLAILGYYDEGEIVGRYNLGEEDRKRLFTLRKITLQDIKRLSTSTTVSDLVKEYTNRFVETVLDSNLRSAGLIKKIKEMHSDG